ncbi:MAG: DsbA family protein [Pseudomonadales bacterium]|jgi:predicted DsbA family dithiol-disulfide isomerase|nr:DsbA family protein [Pseudomonadales bacterium]
MNQAAAVPELELFTDFVCPWCYLGNAALSQLASEMPIKITRTPFPLHPSTPPEGLLLSELLAGRDFSAIHQRLNAEMDKLELPYGERRYTYNSRLAQELALWADTQAEGRPLDALLYQAYFVHDRNIAKIEVLLPLVEQAGLDAAAAQQVLQTRSFSAQVDAAWQRARSFGISGVPTFVYGGYGSSGYMQVQQLRDFIQFVQEKQSQPH